MPDDILIAAVLADAQKRGLGDWMLERPLVVGVSGGADSLALLHMLLRLRGATAATTLHVAHLNHGFRGAAARADAEFIRRTAESWGVPTSVAAFDVPQYAASRGLSSEDAARRVRYAFLASEAQRTGGAVAVAHSADDQVETVLMAILRGTGLSGLAGMKPLGIVSLVADADLVAAFLHNPMQQVPLFRPLLGVWRYEIEAYCTRHALDPRVDASNADHAYRRNRVRHDLIPYLEQHYSLAVKDQVHRLSRIAQSEDDFAAQAADEAWRRLARVEAPGEQIRFDTGEFAAQHEAVQRRLARLALQSVAGTLTDFTFAHIEEAAALLSGAEGAPTAVDLPHEVRVERKAGVSTVSTVSTVSRRTAHDAAKRPIACSRPLAAEEPLEIEPNGPISLAHGWQMATAIIDGPVEPPENGEWQSVFDFDALLEIGPVVLRRRQPRDYLRPFGMSGRRSLQDLMVDAKIPRECRAHLAVLAFKGSTEVLWVPGPGGRRSGHAPLTRDTRRVLEIRFTKK